MTDTLGTIEALARNSTEQHEVAVRLAESGGRLYLDLGDPQWQAVEIDAAGWRVVANPPARFQRPRGMLPLPVPVAGGSLDALRPFVPGGEATFRLVLGWLVQAVRAAGPYMILVLTGEQGAGKSLLARLLRLMIDPNTVALRSVPREERDLAIAATNSYIVAIDNISGLPVWLSDGICRVASGTGFATRELYSNDEETFLSATRPVILNGISDVASRGDILDRSILVTLPTIDDSKRRDERELVAAFDAAAPAILGALCTAVSAAVSRRDKVKLARLPRMADATRWIAAAESALPWVAGDFLAAYDNNRADAGQVALEADSVAMGIRRLMSNKMRWTGTASALLVALDRLIDNPKPRDWPTNPRALSTRLVRLAPAFRAVGLEVQRSKARGFREIVIEQVRALDAKLDAKPGRWTQNHPTENAGGGWQGDAVDAKGAKSPIPCVPRADEEKEEKGGEKRVEVEICTE